MVKLRENKVSTEGDGAKWTIPKMSLKVLIPMSVLAQKASDRQTRMSV